MTLHVLKITAHLHVISALRMLHGNVVSTLKADTRSLIATLFAYALAHQPRPFVHTFISESS